MRPVSYPRILLKIIDSGWFVGCFGSESSIQAFLHDVGMAIELKDWVMSRYLPGSVQMNPECPVREYTVEEMWSICKTGNRLIRYAIRKKWKALVGYLLPIALFGMHLEQACNFDNSSLPRYVAGTDQGV